MRIFTHFLDFIIRKNTHFLGFMQANYTHFLGFKKYLHDISWWSPSLQLSLHEIHIGSCVSIILVISLAEIVETLFPILIHTKSVLGAFPMAGKLGEYEMIARINIAIVFHHSGMATLLGVSTDAWGDTYPIRQGTVEDFHKNSTYIVAYPFVKDGAEEITPFRRTNRKRGKVTWKSALSVCSFWITDKSSFKISGCSAATL